MRQKTHESAAQFFLRPLNFLFNYVWGFHVPSDWLFTTVNYI